MRRLVLCLIVAAAAGCATSAAYRMGRQAERIQDYDRAVLEYQRAVKQSPQTLTYREALERARLRAATQHANTARRFAARGAYKEALEEYRLALELRPNAGIADEVRDLEARQQRGSEAAQRARARTRERALPGLDLGPEAQQPLGLVFRGTSLREAFLALGRAVGVNVTFDPSFQDTTVSLDLKDVNFDQAVNALDAAGRTFVRVVDSRVLNVIPDTPAKRRDFEQQVVKTVYLSNADLKETIDLLRVVLGARRIAPVPGVNAFTINDTPDKIAAAQRIVDAVDKRRAEVTVEVEILEVDRSRLKEYGLYVTSGLDKDGIEGVASGIFPNPDSKFTASDNPYIRSSLLVTSLPGAVLRLLETDSSTRLLANPQLRISEGQTAQARFGDQVPVPVTTFTAFATGGLPQQPIVSYEYKNVGVNIDITPRVHQDGDVTLQLKLDISSVGGPGYQNLPTFNSRTVNSTIRLRDGETNMLAGLILDNERHGLTGLPGIASIPLLGRLFARNHDEGTQTDIVMTLTPHVLRRTDVDEQDLRSFVVGGEASPFMFDVPPPVVPVQPAPTTLPTRPEPGEPGRIKPIQPPQGPPNPNPPSD